MIQVNEFLSTTMISYGIAPRRRACWPTKAQQSTRGVTP